MTVAATIKKISRGVTEVINVDLLAEKLKKSEQTRKPLVIKAGFDPTAPDIHFGHTVLLRKLRQFQDLGHDVSFLIGDFTARVGDPSGQSQLRPKLDEQTILQNAKTYEKQAFKILDKQKTNIVFNSQWLSRLKPQDFLTLSAYSSVAQMLARSDFKKRFESGKEISLLEFMYPLLQGYDSYHLRADIELGGTDQKFNLLMGRQIQEAYGQDPQVVIMTPLLEGLDGEKKMSKSLDNYIGIDEPADSIFGKAMSISDELMFKYYEFLTDADLAQVRTMHPKEAKLNLAFNLVCQAYDDRTARLARDQFDKVFSQKQTPDDLPEYVLGSGEAENLVDILLAMKMVPSKKEFRRLLQQKAISHDDRLIQDENWAPQPGNLKIGKRRFLKLVSRSTEL